MIQTPPPETGHPLADTVARFAWLLPVLPLLGFAINGFLSLKHAAHANAMAALMHDLISTIPGVQVLFPREANSVFVDLPKAAIQALYGRGWLFYNFIGEGGCRLMCSWDTTEADVKALANDLREVASSG